MVPEIYPESYIFDVTSTLGNINGEDGLIYATLRVLYDWKEIWWECWESTAIDYRYIAAECNRNTNNVEPNFEFPSNIHISPMGLLPDT